MSDNLMKTVNTDPYQDYVRCPYCKSELDLPLGTTNIEVACTNCDRQFALCAMKKNDLCIYWRLFWRCLKVAPWSMRTFIGIRFICAILLLGSCLVLNEKINYGTFLHLWFAYRILTHGSNACRIATVAINVAVGIFAAIVSMQLYSAPDFVGKTIATPIDWIFSLSIEIITAVFLFLSPTSRYMKSRRDFMAKWRQSDAPAVYHL